MLHRPKNRFAVDKLRQEREAELTKECTFRPETSSRHSVGPRPTSAPSIRRLSGGPVGDRLFRDAQARARKREQDAKSKENQLEAECTFRPQLVAAAPSSRERAPSVDPASASQRLYLEASARAQKLQSAQRALKDQEVACHPFQPTINPNSAALLDPAQYRPIEQRIAALQRAKNDKLHQLRTDHYEGNPELTFRPAVNPSVHRSGRSDSASPGHVDAGTRLAREAEQSQRRQVERRRKQDDEFQKTFTFTPTISAGSQALIKSKHLTDTGFYDRQRQHEQRVVRRGTGEG